MDKERLLNKLKKALWNYQGKRRLKCHYQFTNRSKNREKMVMLLAGYKEYLYEPVFRRLKANLTDDIDVCIITSGKYDQKIASLCEIEGWSYFSSKENNVPLVQNVTIKLHPNAKYIFKLDEDIFICEGYFERMMRALQHAKTGQYIPGIIAPLIPLNGYGHVRILEKLGLTEVYTEMFQKPVYATGPEYISGNNADVAKFFWGEGGYIPSVDVLNRKFNEDPLEERPCPIRFSIGAILFERSFWEQIHYFTVRLKSRSDLGIDEESICNGCMNYSRPILVSENVVVGHFSFGPQNAAMREYFDSHRDIW